MMDIYFLWCLAKAAIVSVVIVSVFVCVVVSSLCDSDDSEEN